MNDLITIVMGLGLYVWYVALCLYCGHSCYKAITEPQRFFSRPHLIPGALIGIGVVAILVLATLLVPICLSGLVNCP